VTCPAVVRLTVPSGPSVARLTVPSGPRVVRVATPGPPGSSAPVYAIRTDAATPGTVYVGRASAGSSESATVWTIKRRTFSAAGVLLATGTATGAWSNRINLAYS